MLELGAQVVEEGRYVGLLASVTMDGDPDRHRGELGLREHRYESGCRDPGKGREAEPGAGG
jgi:hypothetical protein